MNQPTREEHEELKKRVEKLEQQTEPIKITRLEIDTGTVREEMKGARADIVSIKATQSDHSAFHIEHTECLKEIEDKQETHTELLGQLITIGESHTERFDRIEVNMATKEDVAALKEDIASIKTTQELILQLLQKPRE